MPVACARAVTATLHAVPFERTPGVDRAGAADRLSLSRAGRCRFGVLAPPSPCPHLQCRRRARISRRCSRGSCRDSSCTTSSLRGRRGPRGRCSRRRRAPTWSRRSRRSSAWGWGNVSVPGFTSKYFGSSDDSIIVVYDDLYKITHYANTPSQLAPKYYLFSSLRNIGNSLSYRFVSTPISRHNNNNAHYYDFTEQDYLDAK